MTIYPLSTAIGSGGFFFGFYQEWIVFENIIVNLPIHKYTSSFDIEFSVTYII